MSGPQYWWPHNLFLCGTPIKAYLMQSIDAESCTLHSSRLGKSDLLLTNAIDSHCLVFSNVNWMQLDIFKHHFLLIRRAIWPGRNP